jgi:OmpA-OmpF porin, OOP family
MRSQRILLGLVIAAAAGAAAAETSGALRWRAGGPLGLQPAVQTPRVHCGPISLSCDSAASVPLYASPVAARSLSMQLGTIDASPAARLARSQGLSLNLVGKAGILSDVGIYGRVGTTVQRASGFAGLPAVEGMNYGVGFSWDFSRSGSAVLGFDSYDVRGASGEVRDVRATSLGLQWRY